MLTIKSPKKDSFWKLLTSTKVVVRIVSVVPVDLDLVVVGIEVNVRNVTIRVTRAVCCPIPSGSPSI